ncbi:hypothetical protein IAD21_02508 [Abditibacteriota bacterium]|nr:hypothetical protein IAD21_02508 [Abditibacteriota bacterium]
MKNICKTAALGLVMGALALSTGAQAQMMGDKPMTGDSAMMGDKSMMGDKGMMMTPMPVAGTVLRYYVDRAGFVSAMDVQAADGVKMVRFSPSMAQRLTGTYPVGSQISAYATSSGMGSMMSYDLAGMGAEMPTPSTMMMPMSVTDLDLLRSSPYIMLGGKSMRTLGKLTGYIPDPDTGQVLAIILDKTTLVRVPMNNRLPQASMAPEGVTPLFKNSDVVAYGYEEAPRYGSVSPFAKRIVATGISVAGRALGPFGFGKVMPGKKGTLLNFNLNFFGGAAPREVEADGMGYSPYMAPGDTMSGGAMSDGMMKPSM